MNDLFGCGCGVSIAVMKDVDAHVRRLILAQPSHDLTSIEFNFTNDKS